MKKKILFKVTKEQGVYTASGVDVAIVTEGNTSAELQANIVEALELYLERSTGTYRLSTTERGAIRQGIDAADVGHFAPEDEMEEFHRLHRGA
ncbi:hypothetical protein UP10_01260 [Bradyrhizobium sp. LTSPM299]|uniref:hypothetical protein n=1 Tax=Bradyrhizobium sp. LTSPM299 TaxID=1619233 RepID=UPI0005CA7A22|nr:hypothetical protein [Bradyrhizobium sp. LTSPM299]KJC62045.1 hypothetical protein UP10_01260 [Bradyrhizobium sp. LTSPM299]